MGSFRGSMALFGVVSLSVACAAGDAPKTPAEVAPTPSTVAATGAPPPSATAAEPTAEEKKRAVTAQKVAAERVKDEAEWQVEMERWTPALHAAATAAAGRVHPSGRAAVEAAVEGPFRRPGDAARDKFRHPVETLGFFGFEPTMTILEVLPRRGWYTQILAPALAKRGKLICTSADPNGPSGQWNTLEAQRFKALLDSSPELYGGVETRLIDTQAPRFGLEASVDMVLVFREVHNMVNDDRFDAWLHEIHGALKPGGILGIVEHRGKPDADPIESSKRGYVVEGWVIERVRAAGFKLAGKSEVNANPKDTKDYPEGVWSLPPSYAEGDVNREKYAAIGESDRMTLKFVKAAPAK